MDAIDRKLMNMLQVDIPITERPFAEYAERLGLTEKETLERVRAMDEADRFRRIGPSFAPRRMGYTSTLVAARVPDEGFEATIDFINKYKEITHNYERDNFFNAWFTIIARGDDAVEAILKKIQEKTNVEEIINLPATHIFKIQVQFDVEGK